MPSASLRRARSAARRRAQPRTRRAGPAVDRHADRQEDQSPDGHPRGHDDSDPPSCGGHGIHGESPGREQRRVPADGAIGTALSGRHEQSEQYEIGQTHVTEVERTFACEEKHEAGYPDRECTRVHEHELLSEHLQRSNRLVLVERRVPVDSSDGQPYATCQAMFGATMSTARAAAIHGHRLASWRRAGVSTIATASAKRNVTTVCLVISAMP